MGVFHRGYPSLLSVTETNCVAWIVMPMPFNSQVRSLLLLTIIYFLQLPSLSQLPVSPSSNIHYPYA